MLERTGESLAPSRSSVCRGSLSSCSMRCAAASPITTITTSSSTRREAGSRASLVPRADVGVEARASGLPVGAEAEQASISPRSPGLRYW